MIKLFINFFTIVCLFAFHGQANAAYYVATDGDDTIGTGSSGNPWATIDKAISAVPDGALILVQQGTYYGRIRLRGSFSTGITIRAEPLYQVKLRNNDRVITSYDNNVRGITLEGFDIAHDGPGAGSLVIHLDGGGTNQVSRITLRNNILHDSYNNDILKINNGATNITVVGNVFYNQTGSDEHIDINSVDQVIVQDNIFFNDFEGSGRLNTNSTSSYIVIKDSNGSDDIFTGTRNVTVRRNVFMNWQGSTGSNFVLIGEDGKPYHEAFNILVENNLMLGNSSQLMRAPFGVKGGRDITFRHNTVSGDLPSYAYAMRLNREGSNPVNQNIRLYNNIWADQTGSMGAKIQSGTNDFSDTPPSDTSSFTLNNNLYWNGGSAIPHDSSDLINYTDDNSSYIANPQLKSPVGVTLPRWIPNTKSFGGGYTSIKTAFEALVANYCSIAKNSIAVDNANPAESPAHDILTKPRPAGNSSDIGACEYIPGSGGGVSGKASPFLHLLLHD